MKALGFARLFRSDHFTDSDPPDENALVPILSLDYLAERSERIRFGTPVAPVSFHDPITLARQALTVDARSGGRLILGLGAG